ncbi:hypothetical protein VFPFJ_07198 [Purpureocillium lilacinum]|uniref:Uncharacterized protein n=1 Tax=Purpureocillium lilacinum TaxID=33203 RepID=A0A179HGX2_PURLI|nr:hypothetical protein VFPFJ_07198 [Purpureocillium lilacinum]OAQ88733.1 hypothetical protein VFPFJ_07198 [Purpureocillium lilacinum]
MKLQLLLPFALSHVALAVPPANQALPVPTGIPNIGKYIPSGLPIRDYPGKCRRGKATMQNKLGTNIFHCEVANESIPLLNKTSKKGGISNFPCGLNNQCTEGADCTWRPPSATAVCPAAVPPGGAAGVPTGGSVGGPTGGSVGAPGGDPVPGHAADHAAGPMEGVHT